ncbi:hypothetical protein GCM10011374_03300 [Kocuria dechangensis]|uniref:HNH nuclease domain-containing protein n=1 Tax=Kocuria dechangensis TaxID=1176249 RepID=A0A917LN28_9MICC|nr:HNH endonuclease signature motif containing protein [Kocuria dechangensis]GGG44318.1 hypothetical protein GCM10011374_03300 [Kocuria dechangensis]
MPVNRQHRTYRERRNVAKNMFARQNAPCHICDGKLGPIDYEGEAGMPLSFDLDHKIPVSQGGSMLDLNNFAASHARCNRSKGDGTRRRRADVDIDMDTPPPSPIRRTTYWGNMKPPSEDNGIPPFKWY